MPARILVGSCSWTDPTLIACGRFYPPGVTSAEARLRYYAEQFDIVEVDSTYYAPPSAAQQRALGGAHPGRLRLQRQGVRAAHPPRRARADRLPDWLRNRLPDEVRGKRNVYAKDIGEREMELVWELHREALAPLAAAGKLGAVLFQFPPWFVRSRENRDYLRALPERLPGWPLAVEFRGGGWMDDDAAADTLRLLEEAGLAYVGVDEPQGFPNSTPPLTAVTAPLGDGPPARAQRRARGRAGPARRPTASSTSTATPSSRSGSRACASWPRRRRPCTSSSTTTTRTGACRTRAAWRTCSESERRPPQTRLELG